MAGWAVARELDTPWPRQLQARADRKPSGCTGNTRRNVIARQPRKDRHPRMVVRVQRPCQAQPRASQVLASQAPHRIIHPAPGTRHPAPGTRHPDPRTRDPAPGSQAALRHTAARQRSPHGPPVSAVPARSSRAAAIECQPTPGLQSIRDARRTLEDNDRRPRVGSLLLLLHALLEVAPAGTAGRRTRRDRAWARRLNAPRRLR
jgi:hypothetical protein